MSVASLLVHPLRLVTPSRPDPDAIDEYGHAVEGPETVEQLMGMVQPRAAGEVPDPSQGGVPYGSHVIFLTPRPVSTAAYFTDDPEGSRRFDIVGVRSFEFGSQPHLEVDVNLIGNSVGPTVEAVPEGS